MQRYFTQGTQLAELERLMTLPPGFRPRGGGRRMASHRYTAGDCDCRYCAKKDSCRGAADCVCFEERLEAGCWTDGELVRLFADGVAVSDLTTQTKELFREPVEAAL